MGPWAFVAPKNVRTYGLRPRSGGRGREAPASERSEPHTRPSFLYTHTRGPGAPQDPSGDPLSSTKDAQAHCEDLQGSRGLAISVV